MAKVKIRYRGIADVRIISAKDLRTRGVDVPRDLVFNRLNGWSMNIDATDTLLDIIKAEGSFRVEALTDDGLPGQEILTVTRPDDTGETIKDATTGSTTTKAPEKAKA